MHVHGYMGSARPKREGEDVHGSKMIKKTNEIDFFPEKFDSCLSFCHSVFVSPSVCLSVFVSLSESVSR